MLDEEYLKATLQNLIVLLVENSILTIVLEFMPKVKFYNSA